MDSSPALSSSQSQHRQSAPSTGPQIRSRITVVCAECKRLKLKCDRRSPCGSCTKRDTIVRCIYSPAAAEKVDLHSLNNRLIQVEGILSMITAGQTPPAFQSIYPFTFSSGANSNNASSSPLPNNFAPYPHSQGSHQHHHHYAAPSLPASGSDSIALSTQDVASIWLNELDLGFSWSSSSSSSNSPHTHQRAFSNEENTGYIKLEPSPIDIELSRPCSNTSPHIVDVDHSSSAGRSSYPSRASSPLKRNSLSHPNHLYYTAGPRSTPQILLPALSIYYPLPSISLPGTSPTSSAAFPNRPRAPSAGAASPSANDGFASATTAAAPTLSQYAKPQVTPALLALLPPLSTCMRLLQSAHETVFGVRPVPFEHGWKAFNERCIGMLGGSESSKKEREMKRERREREKQKLREARRARQVYFSGIPGLQDAEMDVGEGSGSGRASSSKAPSSGESSEDATEEQSLTFFAAMCAVLAIGASVSSPFPSPSDSVQETPAFFHALSQQALGVWDTANAGAAPTQQYESERLDYVLACLVGLSYLLMSMSANRTPLCSDEEKDGSGSGAGSGGGPVYTLVGKLVSAARAVDLAGEVAVASRKNGTASESSAKRGSIGLGASNNLVGMSGVGPPGKPTKREREAEKERLKEEWKRTMWWEVLWYDLFTADALGHQPYIPAYSFTSAQLPACGAYPVSDFATSGSIAMFASQEDDVQDQDEFEGDHEDEDEADGGSDPIGGMSTQMHQVPKHDSDPRASWSSRASLSLPNGAHVQQGVSVSAGRSEDVYLGARYRLVQLAQNIKSRMAHPDCCCGYTLDQAAALEGDVRRWQSTLPQTLRCSSHTDEGRTLSTSPSVVEADRNLLAQSCELAVLANLLMIKIYVPFLRHAAAPPHNTSGMSMAVMQSGSGSLQTAMAASPGTSASSIISPASQATLHAAQEIIRAAKHLHDVQVSGPEKSSSALPSLFDLYSPDKLVFDSVMICAHAAFGGSKAGIVEDVGAGLQLLAGVPIGEPQRKVVDLVRKRVGARSPGALKRKHDQIETSKSLSALSTGHLSSNSTNGVMAGFSWSNASAKQSEMYQHPPASTPQQYHNNIIELQSSSPTTSAQLLRPFAQHESTQQSAEQQERELASALTPVATARIAAAARASEESGEKEKKYAKKSVAVPTVGVRLRATKGSERIRALSLTSPPNSQQQQPLMTLAPRQTPSAEAVLMYQQKQKTQLQTTGSDSTSVTPASGHSPATTNQVQQQQDDQRSRSSSISYVQSSEQRPEDMAAYPPFFGAHAPAEMMNMHGMHRKPFCAQDQRQQQQPQQLSPEHAHAPFARHIFEQSQPQMYDPSFDGTHGPSVSSAADTMSYSNVSSPFSNAGAPTSDSNSPFTTGSMSNTGHPSTPTFAAHLPAPPVFGPQPPPQPEYFHSPTSLEAQYANVSPSSGGGSLVNHHQQVHSMSLGDIAMDQNMITIAPAPVYDKPQQHQPAMLGLKAGVDHQQLQHHHGLQQRQQQQMQQHQGSYNDHDMSGQSQQHHAIGMALATPWAGPNQQQQQSSPVAQPFWNNGSDYRFYQ